MKNPIWQYNGEALQTPANLNLLKNQVVRSTD